MAAENVRLIFDMSGDLHAIVKSDTDKELDDPGFSPKGHVSVLVSRASYEKARVDQAVVTEAQAAVDKADPKVGALLAQKADKLAALLAGVEEQLKKSEDAPSETAKDVTP